MLNILGDFIMKYLIIIILFFFQMALSQENNLYKNTGGYIKSTSTPPPNQIDESTIKSLNKNLKNQVNTNIGTYIKCYFEKNKELLQLWGKIKDPKTGEMNYAYDNSGYWFSSLDPFYNMYYTKSTYQNIKNTCLNAYYQENHTIENFESDFINAMASLATFSKDNEFWTDIDKRDNKLFDRVIVFGDSLSDNHTIFNKYSIIPRQDAYFFGRFTNGMSWVEYLAKKIANGNIINFAEAGSEVIPKGSQGIATRSIDEQVAHYNKIMTNIPANISNNLDNTLFIIFSGANDFLDQTYNHDPESLAISFLNTTEKVIQSGAKLIVIPKFFNVSYTPRIQELAKYNPNIINVITRDTKLFNLIIDKKLNEFKEKYQISIFRADAQYFMENLINSNIFKNITTPCNKSGYYNIPTHKLSLCPNHLEYFFWDDVHPSTKVYCQFAEFIINNINNSPTIKHNINTILYDNNCDEDLIK